jgi:hypothetical protein
MGKLISYRKPRLRVTPKGVRVTKPSARIGGKLGLNVSSRGISGSARTKLGTISTGRLIKRSGNSGCGLLLLLCSAAASLIVLL